jgi:hypothetical protein
MRKNLRLGVAVFFGFLSFGFLTFQNSSLAQAQSTSPSIRISPFGEVAAGYELKALDIQEVYIPTGFDSNDNTQIVVRGFLPNLCYRDPHVVAKLKGHQIQVKAFATVPKDPNLNCAQIQYPFLEAASLGTLASGDYQVLFHPSTQAASLIDKKLKIDQAKDAAPIDDYSYAMVKRVEKFPTESRVVLHGFSLSDCLEMDRIEVISNGENVYSILPILKQVRSFCPKKLIPFEISVELPADLKTDLILLHVRTMDGRSVNELYGSVAEGVFSTSETKSRPNIQDAVKE